MCRNSESSHSAAAARFQSRAVNLARQSTRLSMACFYTVLVAACIAGFTVGGPGAHMLSQHIE